MRKELRDSIISGVVTAILGTIVISLIQGKVAWTFLFTYLIFATILKLYIHKRREEKKDQRRERDEKKVKTIILTIILILLLIVWAPWITKDYAINKVVEKLGGPDARFNYLGQDMAVKDIPIEVGWFPFGRYVTFPAEAGWFVTFYGGVKIETWVTF